MHSYSILLNEAEPTATPSLHVIVVPTDVDARSHAEKALRLNPKYVFAEVLRDDERLFRVERPN